MNDFIVIFHADDGTRERPKIMAWGVTEAEDIAQARKTAKQHWSLGDDETYSWVEVYTPLAGAYYLAAADAFSAFDENLPKAPCVTVTLKITMKDSNKVWAALDDCPDLVAYEILEPK